MHKPILLVDIDGTLNLQQGASGGQGYVDGEVDGSPVRYKAEHGDWLDSLQDLYEVTWCSAWGERSPEFGDLLGLPAFDFVQTDPQHGFVNNPDGPTPKLKDVQAYVGDHPFVWIDDVLNDDAHQWVDVRNETIPTLLVEVDSELGLQKADIQLAEDFHNYAFVGAHV